MRVGLAMLVILGAGCAAESERDRTPARWSPDGLRVVWHDEEDSVPTRAEWGPSGFDPLADFVDDEGLTPYELIFEFHSGGPNHTGADEDAWGFPLHFGIGGPLLDGDTLHMFQCSERGAVFDRGEYLAFCRPGEAILNIAYLAGGRVPIDDPPNPPASIRDWWESTIAYASDEEEFTIVPKYAYYGRSEEGYEVPVTFEPRAALPPEPWDDPANERWRVAKFDDR